MIIRDEMQFVNDSVGALTHKLAVERYKHKTELDVERYKHKKELSAKDETILAKELTIRELQRDKVR